MSSKSKTNSRVDIFPKLVVQKGKHGTEYFLANNSDEIYSIGLNILQGWKDSGYLYDPGDISDNFDNYLKFKAKRVGIQEKELKDLLALDEKIKETMMVEKLDTYRCRTFKEQIEFLKNDHQRDLRNKQKYEEAKKALNQKDSKMAWQLVRTGKWGEYMDVKVIPLKNGRGFY